ncbi:MAG: hypothetical protein HC845_13895 [Akkermansiaceae bacterium]|nr:hypothetical protein [Akkermansiaceae bacterium]
MHRILAEAASTIAKSVFREHKVLDHELATAFEENPKWGKRDRSFIAETVFEVARWRRALSFLADSEETTALCAAQWVRMGFDLPEWWSYNGKSPEEMKEREAELVNQSRAIRESIPDWIDALGVAELGAAWDAELSALNQRASVFLRVNTLRTTRPEAIEWLVSFQIAATRLQGCRMR